MGTGARPTAAFVPAALLVLVALVLRGSPYRGAGAEPPRHPTGNVERSTFSIQYRVRVSERDPALARVRWDLAGIDEIRRFRLRLRGRRFYDFSGTGTLEQRGDELIWRPASPYAHLTYKARLRVRRAAGKGFDSYSTSDWVITRAQALFPATQVSFDTSIEPAPRSRSRVLFLLPRGWKVYAAMDEISPGIFRPRERGQKLDRPSGWIALGRLSAAERSFGGTRIVIAKPARSNLDAEGCFDLYARTFPILAGLFPRLPKEILVVSGPDPMWRGGLSGEDSFYLHGDRPLRTADRTSPPLHELFHALAAFRPAADAHWAAEGLAELYSLELQRRAGLLDEHELRHRLRSLEKHGKWNVNLTEQRDSAVTNHSAALVLYALDRVIRRATQGRRSLDDVVRELAERSEPLSTARFQRAVQAVAERDLTTFFQRHVISGEPPRLAGLGKRASATAPRRADGGS